MTKQNWNPGSYERNARYVSDLGMPAVELLRPLAGERILDLGCGDGVLTKKLEEMGCEVVGVDSSPELVTAALSLGLQVIEQDARDLAFHEEFDAVFSNAALHWMKEAGLVIGKVHRALRSGGRFVGEFGGEGNCRTIHDALITELRRLGHDCRAADPWYFPSVAEYAERLTAADFDVPYIELIPRPTPLPTGMLGFLETFAERFVLAAPPEERERFLADVCSRVEPVLRDANGEWFADYVRLRFQAFKTG